MNDKKSLIQALRNTHEKIVGLVSSLSDEEVSIPFHPGVNPPVWEIGHAAFFFEEFILKDNDQSVSYDPSMDDIWDSFNIDHRDRWVPGTIPSREKTLRYVEDIFNAVQERIEQKQLSDRALYLYKYAIFHQNMHVESLIWARQTVAYPKMKFPQVPKHDIPLGNDSVSSLGDAAIPAGRYLIGMPADSNDFAATDFAFDNEKPFFEIELEAFEISKTLVTNQAFLEFIDAGGYENTDHWSWGGRKWLRTELDHGIPPQPKMACPRHPLYWKHEEGQWLERHFDQWLPLEPEFAVTHISFWEVEAYCHWAGRRLPTEFEWEAAALGNQKGQAIRHFPWGQTMDANKVDMNGAHMARVPVTAYPEGDSPFGCRQMLGTVWEWSSSQYLPYAGFTVDMYVFMSTLQFGYHKTTKGGSCATSSILIRGSYRQAYLPTRTDAYVGFRTCAL